MTAIGKNSTQNFLAIRYLTCWEATCAVAGRLFNPRLAITLVPKFLPTLLRHLEILGTGRDNS